MFRSGGSETLDDTVAGDETSVTSGEVMALRLQLACLVAELQPDAVPLPDAPALWGEFDRLARIASGAAMLLTRRVAESRAWSQEGFRTAEDYLALHSGTTAGDQRQQLRASEQMRLSAGATEDAVRAGELSKEQAEAIADAVAANPAAEQRLLKGAGRKPIKELREQAGREKAAADPDPEATERRHHEQRSLSQWTASDGSSQLRANGTVASGALLKEALDPIIDQIIGERIKTGARERRSAYAFDALMRLLQLTEGNNGEQAPKPKIRHRAILRLDWEALWRGYTQGDELCEISGLGPIPIRTARLLLRESTLDLVLTKGVDVMNVTHIGRGTNAVQKVALDFTQRLCTNEDCAHTWLQDDHREDFAKNPETNLRNIDRYCPACHRLKTNKGWKAITGTGRRAFVPPDDSRHPNRRRPHEPCAPPGDPPDPDTGELFPTT